MENLLKQTLATDASSLIYLYRADLLRRAARRYRFFITPEIWQEIAKKASRKESEAYFAITEIVPLQGQRLSLKIRGLSSADLGLIQLFHEQCYGAILSEDGKVLQHCKRERIMHFCSLSLLSELVKQGELTREQALTHFHFLQEVGRYAPWVVEEAYTMLEEGVF